MQSMGSQWAVSGAVSGQSVGNQCAVSAVVESVGSQCALCTCSGSTRRACKLHHSCTDKAISKSHHNTHTDTLLTGPFYTSAQSITTRGSTTVHSPPPPVHSPPPPRAPRGSQLGARGWCGWRTLQRMEDHSWALEIAEESAAVAGWPVAPSCRPWRTARSRVTGDKARPPAWPSGCK